MFLSISDSQEASNQCNEDTDSQLTAAVNLLVDAVVRYRFVDREDRVANLRLKQAFNDRIFRTGNTPWKTYFTGSMYEGMPYEVCGDRDIMYRHTSWIFFITNASRGTTRFIAIRNTLNPAYISLITSDGIKYDSTIEEAILERHGTRYLSSRIFLAKLENTNDELHGPAIKSLWNPERPQDGFADRVLCLACHTWPAEEYLTRPRLHGWPSQSLIDKIQEDGCLVVPVGHPDSTNREVEWRWSFSLAEKELIHYMSDTMACCIFVMKAMKQKYWKSTTNTPNSPLCSYYLKTACLWMFEQSDHGHIIDLCKLVIDWLVTCYKAHTLPHYFIPEQNLIGHLTHDDCMSVIRWLEGLRKNLWEHVLRSITIDERLVVTLRKAVSITDDGVTTGPWNECLIVFVKHLISEMNCDGIVKATESLNSTSIVYRSRKLYKYWYLSDINGYSGIHRKLIDHFNCERRRNSVKYLPETILLPLLFDLSSVLREGSVDMCKSVLNRHLGDLYHSLYVHYRNSEDETIQAREWCHHKAVHYYTEGLEMVYPDGWSDRGLGGYVRLATFYYLTGQADRLEETLQHLEPLLEWGKGECVLNYLGPVQIKARWSVPWHMEQHICTKLIQPSAEPIIFIHSVAMGYYIIFMSSNKVRRDWAQDSMLRCMEDLVENIWNVHMKFSTQVLTDIMKSAHDC